MSWSFTYQVCSNIKNSLLVSVLYGLYHTIALSASNWLKSIYLTRTAFLLEMRLIFWDEILETRWNAAEGNNCNIFWSFVSHCYHFPGSVLVQKYPEALSLPAPPTAPDYYIKSRCSYAQLLVNPIASAWCFSSQDLKSSANARAKPNTIWIQEEIKTGFSYFLPLAYSPACGK